MRTQPTFTFKNHVVFAICLLLLSVSTLSAQENGVYEIKANLITDDTSHNISDTSRERFYNLVYNLHPTAYIDKNTIKIGGNSGLSNIPIVKLTFQDTNSFAILNQGNSDFNNVELMSVMLLTAPDLNNRLNLGDVENLNQLKYIYVECYFECTDSQVSNFITLDNPNIRIFYKVNRPN